MENFRNKIKVQILVTCFGYKEQVARRMVADVVLMGAYDRDAMQRADEAVIRIVSILAEDK